MTQNTSEPSPGKHIVRSFDEDLKQLTDRITEAGALAEHQVARAIRALVDRDDEIAASVIQRDAEIDRLEEEVDQLAIRLLAMRQPVAVDLRVISMTLKISNDIERVGDYAKSIAKRARRLNQQPQLKRFVTIPRVADLVQAMLKDVLDAFVERDVDKAMAVWHRDADVDAYYDSLFRELITFLLEDPRTTSVAIDLMFIAKNLERIGDHATNIAEKIHYMVHGVQINRPRDEEK